MKSRSGLDITVERAPMGSPLALGVVSGSAPPLRCCQGASFVLLGRTAKICMSELT